MESMKALEDLRHDELREEDIMTPRSQHRRLHIQEVQTEDSTENLYHSCCGGMSDKRLVILLTQVSISSLVLIFSGVMLALDNDSQKEAIYMSLISSTLSYWLGKNEHAKD